MVDEAFLGKWRVDLESTTGLQEFGTAMGFTPELIEAYRKLPYTLEISVAGDTYTASVTFEMEGMPPQMYSFKLGETFDYIAFDGTKPKLTVTAQGNRLVESYRLEEPDKEYETVREVVGDVMTSTTTFAGKSVAQKMKKI